VCINEVLGSRKLNYFCDGGLAENTPMKQRSQNAFIAYSRVSRREFFGAIFGIENGGPEAVKNARRRFDVAAGAN
jgi:hypothetical protein